MATTLREIWDKVAQDAKFESVMIDGMQPSQITHSQAREAMVDIVRAGLDALEDVSIKDFDSFLMGLVAATFAVEAFMVHQEAFKGGWPQQIRQGTASTQDVLFDTLYEFGRAKFE